MIARYQTQAMRDLWSEENKFNNWLAVEVQTCRAFHELGKITDQEIEKIVNNSKFDVNRINEIEEITRHDVVAFTRSVEESLGDEKRWIHYGLTSTDVVDTALGYNLKQANEIIQQSLDNIKATIRQLAIRHKQTIMMGRTHGVHAELTTFGFKLALYYEEMLRNQERFDLAKKQIEVGKISGAVGTYANVDPFVQDFVCAQLGIDSSLISTQTLQRDRHAFYISTLCMITNTLDKIAVEIRHLQRTELREVQEGFAKNQTGSSAMPHKKNPISSENISGLSRVMRGYVVTANENVALWHERDISHSSAERVILADATSLCEYMLNRMNNVLKNLIVNEDRMKTNIYATKNVFFSQKVLLTLTAKGMERAQAYSLVQPLAHECFANNTDFKEKVEIELKSYLTDEEIQSCFKIDYHLQNINYVFERLNLE